MEIKSGNISNGKSINENQLVVLSQRRKAQEKVEKEKHTERKSAK